MAMTVHGSNPDSKLGERFERNIWDRRQPAAEDKVSTGDCQQKYSLG
jgi:hypothetical protein